MNLLDASALLSFLGDATGAETVEEILVGGAGCSAVNWPEVAPKIRARDKDWELSRGLLQSYGLIIEPVMMIDAERAARLRKRGSGLSLADRLCLASAERLDATVWTADTAWGSDGRVRQIH